MLVSDERMSMSFWPSVVVVISYCSSTVGVTPTFAASHTKQSIETVNHPCYNWTWLVCRSVVMCSQLTIPLETLLQPKEFSESQIVRQLPQLLRCPLLLLAQVYR